MINPRGVEPVEPSFFDGLNMFQHVSTSPETSTKGLLEEEALQGLSYARLSGEEDEQEPDIFAVGFTQWQKPSPSQHHSCGDSSHPQMGVCICPSISRRHV
jgi:hypothetical protein